MGHSCRRPATTRAATTKKKSTISTLMNPLFNEPPTANHAARHDEKEVHNQHFDEPFVHGRYHLFDQFIKDGAFMPPAGNHAGRHDEKEVQLTVDVNQTHQFVAAVLLIALVAEIDFLGVHRVVCSSN